MDIGIDTEVEYSTRTRKIRSGKSKVKVCTAVNVVEKRGEEWCSNNGTSVEKNFKNESKAMICKGLIK